jgi:glycosyltransferase involved in cell wall biosynthesis
MARSVVIREPVTLVGLRPTPYARVPRCHDLKTGLLTLKDLARVEYEFGCPDIVHIVTQGPFGLAGRRFASRRGIQSTAFCHTNWPAYSEEYLGSVLWDSRRARRACANLGAQLASWFFTDCEILFCHTRATADNLLHRRKRQDVVLVSEFLDTARFPIGVSRRLKGYSSNLSLLYVGRLAPEKSLDKLLQHAGSPKVAVHIVGDGPLRPKLVRDYPNAFYHGCLHGDDLKEFIEGCDYLVLPSRSETLGLVVLEAAACGVPSILLREEVPSELVANYSAGIVVEDFESSEWIDAARAIRASPLYELLTNRCRVMARSQSVEFGAERMLQVWRQLSL